MDDENVTNKLAAPRRAALRQSEIQCPPQRPPGADAKAAPFLWRALDALGAHV